MTNIKNQKIIIGFIIAFILMIAVALGYMNIKEKEAPQARQQELLKQQEQQELQLKEKERQELEAREIAVAKELEIMLEQKQQRKDEAVLAEPKDNSALKPKENTKVNEDGSVITDKEYTKPAPPPPPKPEGSTSDPNSKPEYKPEDVVKPPSNSKPKDGSTRVNDKGENEIYIGGFGWIKDNGGGSTGEKTANGELSGHLIGN